MKSKMRIRRRKRGATAAEAAARRKGSVVLGIRPPLLYRPLRSSFCLCCYSVELTLSGRRNKTDSSKAGRGPTDRPRNRFGEGLTEGKRSTASIGKLSEVSFSWIFTFPLSFYVLASLSSRFTLVVVILVFPAFFVFTSLLLFSKTTVPLEIVSSINFSTR